MSNLKLTNRQKQILERIRKTDNAWEYLDNLPQGSGKTLIVNQYINELKQSNIELVEALECSLAMGLPAPEGIEILGKYGWSYGDRFDLPASKFVQDKISTTLANVKG